MTRIELKEEFSIFTSKMSVLLEKVDQQYHLINEKYGNENADLLLEGFWDTLKSGASKLGKTIGSGVKGVADATSWLKNKGIELGEQALNLVKNLANKVEEYVKNAYNWIVSAPGKFIQVMKNMYLDLKNNLEKLKDSAKDKFQEIVTTVSENIAKKIIEPLKAKWNDFKNNYKSSKESLKSEYSEVKNMANDFVKSGKEHLVYIGKILLKGMENAGFFILGLLMLPFYLAFKGSEYLYQVGETVVKSIKTNAPEVWSSFKEGYAEGRGEAKPAEATSEKFKHVYSFDSFIKR